MTLSNYYVKAVIYPSLAVVGLSIIFSIIDNYNYESEWFTGESWICFSAIISFFYSILICILSLPIFLNSYNTVKENLMLSLLAWFLLPLGCIAITIIHIVIRRAHTNLGFDSDIIYILILTIPFILGLIWTFIKYRQHEATVIKVSNP